MPKEPPSRNFAAGAAAPREVQKEARFRMDVDDQGGAGPSAPEAQGAEPAPLFPPVSAADLLGGKVDWRKVRKGVHVCAFLRVSDALADSTVAACAAAARRSRSRRTV